MKKIHTLFLVILVSLFCFYSTSYSQTASSVQKKIELANSRFVKWFNAGKVDSVVAQYHPNACITGKGCGTAFLKSHFEREVGAYTFKEITTLTVTVDGNKATESGRWKVLLSNSVELSGKYQSEWQKVNNRWMIFKETVLE